MFAVHQLREWASSCVQYFNTDTVDPNYPPSKAEIRRTFGNSNWVFLELPALRRKVQERYPHRTDALAVIQAIRDDAGGTPPHELFHIWDLKRFY